MRVHPVNPARASEAPIVFRNPRREKSSSHSEAPLGNSRCIISWNSSLPANSSRPRQYSGPVVSAICSLTVARSSCLRLVGQTSAPTAPAALIPTSFVFCSSMLMFSDQLSAIVVPFLRLPMAGITTGNVFHRTNLVLILQRIAQRFLLGVCRPIYHHRFTAGRLLITHIENLLARPQILFGVAMAVEAEFHLQ